MTNAGEKIIKKKEYRAGASVSRQPWQQWAFVLLPEGGKKNHLSDPAEKFFPALQLAILRCAAVTEQR